MIKPASRRLRGWPLRERGQLAGIAKPPRRLSGGSILTATTQQNAACSFLVSQPELGERSSASITKQNRAKTPRLIMFCLALCLGAQFVPLARPKSSLL